MKKTAKIISSILALSMLLFAFASCSPKKDGGSGDSYSLKVGTIKGPTGMGMAKIINDNLTDEKYTFELFNDATAISAKLLGQQLDIAAVPVNLAAVVNKKTEGAYVVAAINTLGVLYIMENGTAVSSVSDLEGKTIHAYGQGATPEYMLAYILEKNGLKDKVNVQWYPTPAELSTLAAENKVDLIMLPEPQITASLTKNANLRVAIDITKEWDKVSENKAVQGCIVVKKEIAKKYPEKISQFLDEYKASVKYVNENPAEASVMIAANEIIPAAPVAALAIPRCNIVFIEGDEMISDLNAFYTVLFNANPQSVGGTMPNESLYYKR
ncbi:MAG: ABC transporter substrate-binding protein [Ruminococcaceae bacterium]|nr:ABC transporter substrate-binding protein [Oscillospiraceae bacterium]